MEWIYCFTMIYEFWHVQSLQFENIGTLILDDSILSLRSCPLIILHVNPVFVESVQSHESIFEYYIRLQQFESEFIVNHLNYNLCHSIFMLLLNFSSECLVTGQIKVKIIPQQFMQLITLRLLAQQLDGTLESKLKKNEDMCLWQFQQDKYESRFLTQDSE